MPKVKKIFNASPSSLADHPLYVTVRKGRKRGKRRNSPSIRVKCCYWEKHHLVIYHDGRRSGGNPKEDTLEIGGVHGSVHQWRQVLLPLLGLKHTRKR